MYLKTYQFFWLLRKASILKCKVFKDLINGFVTEIGLYIKIKSIKRLIRCFCY